MKKLLKEVLSSSLYIFTVLLITFLIVKFVAIRTEVIGPSMQPTLYSNDNLITEKLSYRFGDPKRFDVIVFPFQYAENTYYIKRIIGLPGETVQIDEEGNIYINGEVLEENYGKEACSQKDRRKEACACGKENHNQEKDNERVMCGFGPLDEKVKNYDRS